MNRQRSIAAILAAAAVLLVLNLAAGLVRPAQGQVQHYPTAELPTCTGVTVGAHGVVFRSWSNGMVEAYDFAGGQWFPALQWTVLP